MPSLGPQKLKNRRLTRPRDQPTVQIGSSGTAVYSLPDAAKPARSSCSA